jgi:hypothetical protein
VIDSVVLLLTMPLPDWLQGAVSVSVSEADRVGERRRVRVSVSCAVVVWRNVLDWKETVRVFVLVMGIVNSLREYDRVALSVIV